MIHIRAKTTGKLLHSFNLYSLSGADLHEFELCNADLKGMDLSGANLSHSSLNGADLSGANLTGADLSRARLIETDITGANLAGANLESAWLIRASLLNANLTNARITNALMWEADLRSGRLDNADFRHSAYNDDTVWPEHLKVKDLGTIKVPFWETDQTIGHRHPEGLHTPTEFTPLIGHPAREVLTRIRRSIHRRADTSMVQMQFCELPEERIIKVKGERRWAVYNVGPGGRHPWWEAKFLDSKMIIEGEEIEPFKIEYDDIKRISYPNLKSAHLPGGILMPKHADHNSIRFLYDTSVIETYSGGRHEVRAAVGRDGLRDISFWYEIVRGAVLDQERKILESGGTAAAHRMKKSAPYAVVVIRGVEDNEIVRVHIVSMCEQTIERLKLTRDLPQGNVVIAAPSGYTRALIKGRTLVLASPVTLQSGQALTVNVA